MPRRNLLYFGGLVLVGLGAALILAFILFEISKPSSASVAVQHSSPTPEPLIPTRTRAPERSTVAASGPTSSLLTPTAAPTPVAQTQPASNLWEGLPRWGVGVPIGPISRYNIVPLSLGWYLDWRTALDPVKAGGIEYAQMVRLSGGILRPDESDLARIARANPGSLWLIGNEPDVKWQDNVEPVMYARLYQRAYVAIKNGDPTARVAIGGVAQPTPLRLRYLDLVLEAYQQQNHQTMPVDVWNVHNFILREERGSWGVDIPPGLPDNTGKLYNVDDSGNLDVFRQQILDFRRWMAARGFRDRPLIVSEYGIPMPEDYGFPPDQVLTYIAGTFDYFLTATDSALGYPADNNRLVQRWCWYSLDDTMYPTGRLFDPETGALSETGKGWAQLSATWIFK